MHDHHTDTDTDTDTDTGDGTNDATHFVRFAHLGQWLSRQRKARDLTQEELAQRIGCSVWLVQKIEVGNRRPSKQMAEMLADYFHIPQAERDTFLSFARGRTEHDEGPRTKDQRIREFRPSIFVPGQPSARNSQPEPSPPIVHPNNLPVQLTSFVGRAVELPRIRDLMLTSEVRLLTLTGPPGTGKTRLALQMAAELLEEFTDGVFFVNLAPITDPSLAISEIAQTLGVGERLGKSLLEGVRAYLGDRRVLLVLDNFEQVVEAALTVGELLRAAPGLKVMVTSRVPLHIRGEKEFAVSPLHVPDLQHLPSLERLGWYEAIQLFTERAADVSDDFELTDDNASAVARICARLDGLPLAIELAAVRVKILSPEAILSRLESRLELLTDGPRDAPTRQRTLRSAIEWSYDLLDEEEQKMFRRLGVFQGGRSLEAIEAICNSEGLPGMRVLDIVSSLLDKGLLRREEGEEGAPRFVMLETIHEYAREKLEESAEVDALQREHALYFMRLAEEAELQLIGKKQAEWYNRLEEEHDNLRAALRWERETESIEDVDMGLRTASALFQFWQARGYFSEGREQLEALLSKVDIVDHSDRGNVRAETVPRIKVLNVIGMLAWRQGDYPAARSALEEALAIGRKLGRKDEMAFSLIHLGAVAYSEGDYSTTRTLQEESLALWRATGNTAGIASSLSNLGLLAYTERDYPRARSLFEQSLAMRREIGNARGIAASLSDLGFVAYDEGDYPTARSLFEEALTIDRELGNKLGISIVLTGLGLVVCREGAYSKVHPLNEDLTLRREIGDKKGNGESAGGQAEEVSGIGVVANAPERVEGAGRAEHIKQGVRLLGAVEGLLVSIGGELEPAERTPYEQGIASARSQLGEEAFEKAMQEGRAMSMEEAIEYALEQSSDIPTGPEPLLAPAITASGSSVSHERSSPRESESPHPDDLTEREVEVLRLIAAGKSNAEIAFDLVLSLRTVERHISNVYQKIGAHGKAARVSASTYAATHGFTAR